MLAAHRPPDRGSAPCLVFSRNRRRARAAGADACATPHRRAHGAGALLAIERERIGAYLLVPIRLLEASAQPLRLEGEAGREPYVVHVSREPRGDSIGEVHVALHLAERDRAAGEAAIGVE